VRTICILLSFLVQLPGRSEAVAAGVAAVRQEAVPEDRGERAAVRTDRTLVQGDVVIEALGQLGGLRYDSSFDETRQFLEEPEHDDDYDGADREKDRFFHLKPPY
jgi:hypothetical protein